MNTDILGLLVLLISLLVIIALQVGALMGIMWIMHRLIAEKLVDTTYAQFDFDNYRKPALVELLLKLGVIVAPATLLLHLFIFLFCWFSIRKFPSAWGFSLMILEAGAIAAGLHFVLKLDRFRLIMLAGGSALFYIIVYGLFLQGKLS